MPAEYSKSVSFTGSATKALDVARATFINQSFQVTASSDDELRVTNRPSGTKENLLKGVSEGWIITRATAKEIKTILSGTEKLNKFLRIFPWGGAFFLLAIGITFRVVALTGGLTLSDLRQWWIGFIAVLIPVLTLSRLGFSYLP